MEEESIPLMTQQAPRSRLRSCGLILAVCFGLTLPFAAWLGYQFNYLSHLAKRASGGNDLHIPMTACMNFTKDHAGVFPPLDPEVGRLMFERKIMHDKYGVTGKTVTMEHDRTAPFRWREYRENPALTENADLINDHSWWYLGYAVKDEAQAREFLKAYLLQALLGRDFSEDLAVPGKDRKIARLHILEESLTDSATDTESSRIPVFVERPGHYRGFSGGHVAFLDGHVEYRDYPGPFPMSQEFISVLRAIDQVGCALNTAALANFAR